MEMETAGYASMAVAEASSGEHIVVDFEDGPGQYGHFAVTANHVPMPAATFQSLPLDDNMHLRDIRATGMPTYGEGLEPEPHTLGPRTRSSRMFKGDGVDTVKAARQEKRPLQLLDLPLDILREIVKEVTHTNDLTSLALCHSALHRLAIPHIYSRFDIVWPENSAHSEQRSGVDALTYGLATLVMAEELFGEAPEQRRSNRYNPDGTGLASDSLIRRRRGNHYALFTKKFSLGNGPPEWVQEYLITKEGGKMLGTLVALAIARMRSLETFIWDMPTGILRDVWNSLGSLGDRGPSRLEKVWVRWHDNTADSLPQTTAQALSTAQQPPPVHLTSFTPSVLHAVTQANATMSYMQSSLLDRVERPSFSQLPPLKSLSVLDIDELAYLDEMAVLIGNSVDKLEELRVGIARHAIAREWVSLWQSDSLQQVDVAHPGLSSVTIGERRLGGVLGVLVGFVRDLRPMETADGEQSGPRQSSGKAGSQDTTAGASTAQSEGGGADFGSNAEGIAVSPNEGSPNQVNEQESTLAGATSIHMPTTEPTFATSQDDPLNTSSVPAVASSDNIKRPSSQPGYLNKMLKLDKLELERVPLFIPALQKGIDWTRLTSVTLLTCLHHEHLWKALRKIYAPMPKYPEYPQPRVAPASSRKSSKTDGDSFNYPIQLKKVHTNQVSPALISFLKEALAPNSLETLFLQEARSYHSSVTIDAIYRGPVRRHRASLRRILIDSSEKELDGSAASSSRWRRWIVSREMLSFVCSGKMPALRELGVAVDYRDWHHLLRSLPLIPHLRSLYIPFLADHPSGENADSRELALSIVDIVALRPDVQLCYLGISTKCFEVLENRPATGNALGYFSAAEDAYPSGLAPAVHAAAVGAGVGDDDEDEDEDDEDDDEDGAENEEEESDDEQSELSSDAGSDHSDRDSRMRLREILFYDDKVAIFKARHGRL